MENRCFLISMDEFKSLCISSIQPNIGNASESIKGRSSSNTDNSALENTTRYPQVLHLSCENPILLPIVNILLKLPYDLEQKHPMEKTLKLVAWTVCGSASLQEASQRKQRKYLARHGEPKLINNINLHGDSGWAGVAAGVWIHFNHL